MAVNTMPTSYFLMKRTTPYLGKGETKITVSFLGKNSCVLLFPLTLGNQGAALILDCVFKSILFKSVCLGEGKDTALDPFLQLTSASY